MIQVTVARILDGDNKVARYRVVAVVSSQSKALGLCDCPGGHESQEAAVHCEKVQETIRRILQRMRDARRN
jgi:hypothetical protein